MPRVKTTTPTKIKLDDGRPAGIVKKSRRKNQDLESTRKVKKFQRTVNLIFPRAAVKRIVREIVDDVGPEEGLRINADAFTALQEAAERHVTTVFNASMRNMVHASRQTLMPVDMRLALKTFKIMNGEHVALTPEEAAQYVKKQEKKKRKKTKNSKKAKAE